jgi:hypothetical protein
MGAVQFPEPEMSSCPVRENEAERQDELDSFHILDSEPDKDFDCITRIASQMLAMPIALISLVDQYSATVRYSGTYVFGSRHQLESPVISPPGGCSWRRSV